MGGVEEIKVEKERGTRVMVLLMQHHGAREDHVQNVDRHCHLNSKKVNILTVF